MVKSPDGFLRFGDFTLDPVNRRLQRSGTAVELGGRYLDALILLAGAPGELITKDRLHEEVWCGVPVTDEALSQAIMALRRALGDDALRPRFIETVPRHGYRFIGDLTGSERSPSPAVTSPVNDRLQAVAGGVAGTAVAGLVVGLVYGSVAGSAGPGSALSLVLVLVGVSMLAAIVSGFGIAGGIGWLTAPGSSQWWRPLAGGALGGLVVGGSARLLGLDTLRLLAGSAPDRMAGAGEGLAAGAAVGLAYRLARQHRSPFRHAIVPGLGAIAGAVVIAAGGTLMAGSLAAMVERFPGASLSMEWTKSSAWLLASGAFEGALFVGFAVAGMIHGSNRAKPV